MSTITGIQINRILGYPIEILNILRENDIDKQWRRALIHGIPELKPHKEKLPKIAIDLKTPVDK